MAQKSVSAIARKALLKRSRDLLRPRLGRLSDPDDLLAGLDAAERRELEEIHAALERIERGRFGRCEGCGDKIDPSLLEVTPWRRSCSPCAARLLDPIPGRSGAEVVDPAPEAATSASSPSRASSDRCDPGAPSAGGSTSA